VSTKTVSSLLGLSIALLAGSTTVVAQAPSERVEEITVIGRQEFIEKEFTARRTGSNVDPAKLMDQVPGGAASSNGPLSGQIQYRGMFGPRMNVRVDGMLIHGGGPNWMAPPLHHIPAGLMEEMVVEQGIPSITTGGGIGGAATALWKRPSYSSGSGWNFTGDTEAAYGTVDEGTSISGVISAFTAWAASIKGTIMNRPRAMWPLRSMTVMCMAWVTDFAAVLTNSTLMYIA
jgi:iron complex outermembrane recepter protein